MKKTILFLLSFIILGNSRLLSQCYWQQKIDYNIRVRLDQNNHKIFGKEKIIYSNNSPDSLSKLYFHLFWNAFQPGSSMDHKSLETGRIHIPVRDTQYQDWDSRVRDRIHHLISYQEGKVNIVSIKVNNEPVPFKIIETIMEVQLFKPILSKSNAIIEVEFESQIPIQIRRSGRDNAEGIMYSMSQWYPKLSEYDNQGWHTNQYIAREFYGVIGNFEVTIEANKNFIIAASGVLTNKDAKSVTFKPQRAADNSEKNDWVFKAENIHDFVWAADTAYKTKTIQPRSNLQFQVFYKFDEKTTDTGWQRLLWVMAQLMPYIEDRFGIYPYPKYSFIQGGDGGMEYGMATLLKSSSLTTAIHEFMHSWYQGVLATNEYLYPWLDEGFTDFATDEIYQFYLDNIFLKDPYLNQVQKDKLLKSIERNSKILPKIHSDSYQSVLRLIKSSFNEPLSTPADYYHTNFAYSTSAYSKGSVYLSLIGYIIGQELRDEVLKDYYKMWQFKHPTPDDFIRIAEKKSGIQLHWFLEFYMNTTKKLDYGITEIKKEDGQNKIVLKRLEQFPMPIDILVTYKDSSTEWYQIPLDIMISSKKPEYPNTTILPYWQSTSSDYSFSLKTDNLKMLKSIEIDPKHLLLDINRQNNKIVLP